MGLYNKKKRSFVVMCPNDSTGIKNISSEMDQKIIFHRQEAVANWPRPRVAESADLCLNLVQTIYQL